MRARPHLELLHGAALLLAAPHRHAALVVAALPSVLAQNLIPERGEVRVVRDLNRHLQINHESFRTGNRSCASASVARARPARRLVPGPRRSWAGNGAGPGAGLRSNPRSGGFYLSPPAEIGLRRERSLCCFFTRLRCSHL